MLVAFKLLFDPRPPVFSGNQAWTRTGISRFRASRPHQLAPADTRRNQDWFRRQGSNLDLRIKSPLLCPSSSGGFVWLKVGERAQQASLPTRSPFFDGHLSFVLAEEGISPGCKSPCPFLRIPFRAYPPRALRRLFFEAWRNEDPFQDVRVLDGLERSARSSTSMSVAAHHARHRSARSSLESLKSSVFSVLGTKKGLLGLPRGGLWNTLFLFVQKPS